MGKKKEWYESKLMNERTYIMYYNRLMELAVNMFKWENLPDTVDERYLELALFCEGKAVYFNDEIIGDLCLRAMIGGEWDVYGTPTIRTAYATNGYQRMLNNKNSVLIYNNYTRTNSMIDIEMYAKRLTLLERVIDVNINAQKTPVLLRSTENQRLTLLNLYKQYDGNTPFIFGDKNLDLDGLTAISTNAPFVGQELNILKRQIWNEALTYLGIENSNTEKRERLVSTEVNTNLGGVDAQRYCRLNARRKACEEINKMFNTNISVDFRPDPNFDKPIEEENEEDYEGSEI